MLEWLSGLPVSGSTLEGGVARLATFLKTFCVLLAFSPVQRECSRLNLPGYKTRRRLLGLTRTTTGIDLFASPYGTGGLGILRTSWWIRGNSVNLGRNHGRQPILATSLNLARRR
jgi:hypothetical protein